MDDSQVESSEASSTTAPKWFTVVAILAVIWNILGILSFVLQISMTPEDIAALPAEQQLMYEAMPIWVTAMYGLAVITGALGSLGLLLKRKLAVPLLAISLIAVIAQMGYSLMLLEEMAGLGPSGLIMPLLVTAIAAYLWILSRNASGKGWLH